MKENLYRLWFAVLMVGLLALVARNVFGQPPAESSLGTFPLPNVVGMSGKTPPPISIAVVPKIALINEFKRTTFHIRWKIEPHPDNRSYSLSYDCGMYSFSSQGLDGENEARTRDRFEDILVTQVCVFKACVVRVGGKNFCVEQKISTPEEPP